MFVSGFLAPRGRSNPRKGFGKILPLQDSVTRSGAAAVSQGGVGSSPHESCSVLGVSPCQGRGGIKRLNV